MRGDENGAKTVEPLRWQWCKPDKPGLWAFAGWDVEAPDTDGVVRIAVKDPAEHRPGWWSFLMDLTDGVGQ